MQNSTLDNKPIRIPTVNWVFVGFATIIACIIIVVTLFAIPDQLTALVIIVPTTALLALAVANGPIKLSQSEEPDGYE
jgi:VIT1/CCC1 family predicted Fe2+/Mn2+ transporter